MFYNARYYSPLLSRFVGADTIVPEPGNPQSLNRYMYVLGNPLTYSDPSGHFSPQQIENYLSRVYGDKASAFLDAWKSDELFWKTLIAAKYDDILSIYNPATKSYFTGTFFQVIGTDDFSFTKKLHDFQGKGPYGLNATHTNSEIHPYEAGFIELCATNPEWAYCSGFDPNHLAVQPVYDYSTGTPRFTNSYRNAYLARGPISFSQTGIWSGGNIPAVIEYSLSIVAELLKKRVAETSLAATGLSVASGALVVIGTAQTVNNALVVSYEIQEEYYGPATIGPR